LANIIIINLFVKSIQKQQ